MPYLIQKPTKTKTLQPTGTHVARVFSIVHIGTHTKESQGKPWDVAMARISFELPLEKKVFKEGEPEKPIVITKKCTESLGEKANLRKLIEACIGTTLIDDEAYAFDMHEIVGKACLITIKHKVNPANKEEYAFVESVNALMKGQECPAQINPSYIFTLSPFDNDKYLALPEFIQKEIAESPEYKNRITDEKAEELKALRDGENAGNAVKSEIDPDSIDF